nr:sporulation integral membrane protein YtvI [uncultured Bacillus sp.]
MNTVYLNRAARFLFVLASIVIGFVGLFYLTKITYPFLIGLLIAFLINPFVNFFQLKAKMPRSLAVIIVLFLVFSVFAGVITLLIAEIVSSADKLAKIVPEQLDTLISYLEHFVAGQIIPLYNQLAHLFDNLGSGQQETILKNIQNVGSSIGSTLGDFIQRFFTFIPNIISWFPNAATVLIFSLLATFFISKDWQRLSRLGSRLLPKKAKKSSQTVFFDLKKALFGFIKAQLTLISLTTIIILIGLLILRVNYAVTIALITGLVDLLPYLGTGLIFVPWIIYEVIAGKSGIAIGLAVLYIIVLVQRQLMEPKILSSNIGLDPLATLLALFIGFKLIGFLGLIAGPVALVIITTLHKANVFRDLWKFIKDGTTA